MRPVEFVVAGKGSCRFLLPQQPRILRFLIFEIENDLAIQEITETKTKEDTKRRIIIDFITKNPGIRYRELLRLIGFSNGSLAHHLSDSKKQKLYRYADRRTVK